MSPKWSQNRPLVNFVGSDVTDSKPNGEVILGEGNITLSAEYVEIKNSTAVPLGTTLTIGN